MKKESIGAAVEGWGLVVDSNQSQANILVWSAGIFIALSFSRTHIYSVCLSVFLVSSHVWLASLALEAAKTISGRVTGDEWSEWERDTSSSTAQSSRLTSDNVALVIVIVIGD